MTKYLGMLMMLALACACGGEDLDVDSTTSSVITGKLYPIGAGTTTQLDSSTGNANWQNEDDIPCDGTTSYNSTSVIAEFDDYQININGFGGVPDGATITKILIGGCFSTHTGVSAGQTSIVKVHYRWNGTFFGAGVPNYTVSGTTPVDQPTRSFSGLSLVKGPTSDLEIGFEFASGSYGGRDSQMFVVITYTP